MGKPDKVSDSMATINGGKVECGVRGGDGSGPAGDEWWTVVERDWWEERRENVDEEREKEFLVWQLRSNWGKFTEIGEI
ncbi:hypothetical protein LguiB_009491 [Lonicera macranthoides]